MKSISKFISFIRDIHPLAFIFYLKSSRTVWLRLFRSRNCEWKSLSCWFCVHIFGSVQIHTKQVDNLTIIPLLQPAISFDSENKHGKNFYLVTIIFYLCDNFYPFVSVSTNNLVLSRKQIVNYFNIDFPFKPICFNLLNSNVDICIQYMEWNMEYGSWNIMLCI